MFAVARRRRDDRAERGRVEGGRPGPDRRGRSSCSGSSRVFAVTTLANLDTQPARAVRVPAAARTSCPSVALTFFAFLGFGVITFTAKDLAEPRRQLPRAMYLALGIATVIYVAVALGVFGTLTVQRGHRLGRHRARRRRRARPRPRRLLAHERHRAVRHRRCHQRRPLSRPPASATRWPTVGQFPPGMSHRIGGRVSAGLLLTAVAAMVLAAGFDLSAIASIGSAVALLVFTLITAAHIRVRHETGARLSRAPHRRRSRPPPCW